MKLPTITVQLYPDWDLQLESGTLSHVLWFATEMERKLAQNRHKGDANGWKKDSVIDLLKRLRQETDELEAAIESGGADAVVKECSDVGNFAMMIATKYRDYKVEFRNPSGEYQQTQW